MSKKKNQQAEQNIEAVENVLSRTEQYIENNQKSLSVIVAAIFIIIGGYMAFNKFYVDPMQDEAQIQMFTAEQYFEKDSFNLALNGDGNAVGFLDIIDDYSLTSSGNIANYYSGICYLHLGQYEDAIDYLEKFDANENVISALAISAIGDAYAELGEHTNARDYYLKASNMNSNDFTTPIYLYKAGLLSEELGENEIALEAYTKLEADFPESNEGRKVEKFIARVKLKLNID